MMSGEQFDVRICQPGSDEANLTYELVERYRQAAVSFIAEAGASRIDPRNHMSIAAMAAGTFAGAVFGQLVATGIASPQDQRRWIDALARNARQGVSIGRDSALRAMTDGLTPQ